MSNKENVSVVNEEGTDYLCKVQKNETPEPKEPSEREDCVEKDVAERYSGNL